MSTAGKVGHGLMLKVKGTPYEQGKQQGEGAAELILENVNHIKRSLANMNVKQAEYDEMVKKNLDFYKKTEPEIVDELKGIAEGSGIPFDDIVMINLPLFFVLKWLPQECSSILARGSATYDGKTYLVKNRDMGSEKVDHVILHREYPDGRKMIEVNGAGIVTFPGNGLNDHGLAISTSGVWSKEMEFDLTKVENSHILLNSHLLLEKCRNVDEAIEYLKAERRMSGMNFVLVDKEKAVAVEVTLDGIYVTNEEAGILVRTNHCLCEEIAHLNTSEEVYPSTYKRYERATEYLQNNHGKIQFQHMLEIASDHEHGPINSICRHGADEKQSTTIYTSIIILEDFQVWTALSNPCEALRVTHL